MELVLELLADMALISMGAYLIGRNRFIVSCAQQPYSLRGWLTLTSIFTILSIMGTYNGIPVEGALANTRLVGTLMSGIMGGPVVGLSVGLISGLHRWLVGGFTAEACGIATVIGGLIAGMIRQKQGLNNLSWRKAAVLALVAEIMQKGMVLLFAKPFATAWALEKAIALPTTFVSVFGTGIFMLILKDMQTEQEVHSAKAAELSLEIASRTLPFLRQGLNRESAEKTAQIILELTKVDAVSITDRELVLAFIGKGDDHHKAGEAIMTYATHKTLSNGQVNILHTAEERGCPVENCPLQSSVVAPLVASGAVVGTVKLNKAEPNGISAVDVRLAKGIANLLSVQIELAEVDNQRKMREKAELKALQAQINPHFLFNTLNIIMSFCRTNPDTARTLLGHLAIMLQYSFAHHGDFSTIKEEMEGIQAYLEIVKARFGSRLIVAIDIDEKLLNTRLPILTIQPLVENAIQHGLFPKLNECKLTIDIYNDHHSVVIKVADNGIGIAPEKLASIFSTTAGGIGVRNVNQRLKGIYGEGYGIAIDSKLGVGTSAVISIPREGGGLEYAG